MSSLEAVFSESAAGTLAYAMAASGKDHTLASAIGVICSPEEEPLSPVEQEALLHREKARQQALWKKAIPLAGDRQNICPLSLVLTLGEIDEEGIGPKRQKVLSRLMDIFPQGKEAAEELTLQNQVIEHHWVMLFQILSVHPSVFSDRAFLIGKLPIRDVVISNQYVFDIVDTLFVFHNLDLDFKIFVTSRLTGVVVV